MDGNTPEKMWYVNFSLVLQTEMVQWGSSSLSSLVLHIFFSAPSLSLDRLQGNFSEVIIGQGCLLLRNWATFCLHTTLFRHVVLVEAVGSSLLDLHFQCFAMEAHLDIQWRFGNSCGHTLKVVWLVTQWANLTILGLFDCLIWFDCWWTSELLAGKQYSTRGVPYVYQITVAARLF